MAVEELEDAIDHAGRVDALRLELLHDVEELRTRNGKAARGARSRARGRRCA